ncbi:hypothetical protein CDD82_228 [Ophiocordyceps australis]|uniref:DUF202 domain-containing protein n=1 Tax=Ophiocordyceps australis TaxID=1399860 RepID=A0A2C5XDW6_9HYPO|nr:hypothetical protein CDD82_228 [Ophiocordyceps australis]
MPVNDMPPTPPSPFSHHPHHVQDIDDEAASIKCCAPLSALSQPVSAAHAHHSVFFAWPPLGPLLFENESSDARDHCANERTFLSYLRLAVYIAVLSVAITLDFHLRQRPSDLERRIAKPLGLVFCLFAFVTLFMGLGNYIKTLVKYSRKAAIVQTGWRTQLVLATLALSIVATSIVLLVVPRLRAD